MRSLYALLHGSFSQLHEAWMTEFAAAFMRLPGKIAAGEWTTMSLPILEALRDTVVHDTHEMPAFDVELVPGQDAVREIEKTAAFLGARLAASHSHSYDVSALFWSLKQVLARRLGSASETHIVLEFCEWISAVALDAFAQAKAAQERESWRDLLEHSCPLVMVTPDLPALFLLGPDHRTTISSNLGRLLLQCVRVGAKSAILELSGLAKPDGPELLSAVGPMVEHPRIGGQCALLLVGAENVQEIWQNTWGKTIELGFFGYFDEAVKVGLSKAGQRLIGT